MRRLLLLALVAHCFAQTQGNLPNVIDGAIDGIIGSLGNGIIKWPEPIAINDTLVMCLNTEQAGGPFPMSDLLGNSWTCTTPTQTPSPATNGYVNMCYTKSSFAGADTLTYAFAAGDGSMVGGRFAGLGVVDGSVAAATSIGVGAGGTSTIATSQTTSVNNALLIMCGGRSNANTGWHMAPSTGESVASINVPIIALSRTGTKGSQTATFNIWNGPTAFGSNTTFAMQTLAFKPTTSIAVIDTKLPDAGSGVAYEADLHCIGGTAAQTYSLVSGSLPAGLSLAGATGKITGSTVATGTTTLGFQCTDGTLTSATDTLSLTVGTAFNTPFVRSYITTFNGLSATLNGAVCGDMIHILARGTDTHAADGWVQAVSGNSNFLSDSLNSPVQRMVLPLVGTPEAPINDYVLGPLTQSGTDVITISNNQSANTGLTVSGIFDVANVQSVSDQGASSEVLIQNGTLSPSFTSIVPNTLLLTSSSTSTGGLAIALGAPFTPDSIDSDTFGYSVYGHALIASPGSTTATYTVTGASTVNQYGAIMVPLRPALPSTCPVPSGNGEKIRRRAF